jgi:hypothetical protein
MRMVVVEYGTREVGAAIRPRAVLMPSDIV